MTSGSTRKARRTDPVQHNKEREREREREREMVGHEGQQNK